MSAELLPSTPWDGREKSQGDVVPVLHHLRQHHQQFLGLTMCQAWLWVLSFVLDHIRHHLFYPLKTHFTDEETKAQREEAICSRSQIAKVESALETRLSEPRACAVKK